MNKTPSQAGVNKKTSLKHQKNPLAVAANQLKVLNGVNGANDPAVALPTAPTAPTTPTRIEVDETRRPRFEKLLQQADASPLAANGVEILQVNLGKMCNMTCTHCHVDAGPDRREIMTRETIDACLEVLRKNPEVRTLDLTGGAPEMNPHFREMVVAAREMDRHVIDRCNLTILLAKGFEYLPEFLAQHQVEIVASLPCYLEDNTDQQRGEGAYSKSVEALTRLNALGYGKPDSGLTLTLVYNPVGQSLPPDQAQLEEAYRKELRARFGIEFNRLFTITNMPVSRYLDYLMRIGELESYMQTLIDAFNPASIQGLMCRNTISVSWDGKLYDCDFNQMLELDLEPGCPKTIHDFDIQQLRNRQITIDQHCFGCTAGGGSGCQGSIM
jgi:radical SAM/Cys-rich protein